MTEHHPNGYFRRVAALTPTRFWINNPTLDEARLALDSGAVSCTTNPAYGAKMLERDSELSRVRSAMRNAAERMGAVPAAAREVQRMLVAPLLAQFLTLFTESGGTAGWVSIQGDPFREDDPREIIESAHEDCRISRNVIAKIPVTDAGLTAIETLAGEGVPIIATEVMSIAQALRACESYERATSSLGAKPAFYVTHITGIFDEYLAETAGEQNATVDPDILRTAGIAVARKLIRTVHDRGSGVAVLGGGARDLRHFTELVGEPVHVTVNWRGFAEELIARNLPVVSRAGCPVPEWFIEELLSHLPDFRRAYQTEGIGRREFADFGPVARFRRSFEDGWRALAECVSRAAG